MVSNHNRAMEKARAGVQRELDRYQAFSTLPPASTQSLKPPRLKTSV